MNKLSVPYYGLIFSVKKIEDTLKINIDKNRTAPQNPFPKG